MKTSRNVLLVICLVFSACACRPVATATAAFTPVPTFTAAPSLTPSPTLPPTPRPTPVVYDGAWYGTTSAGGKISFTIIDNGVASINISFGLTIKNGSCDVTMNTTISPYLSVSLDHFSIPTADLKVSGKFDSAATASGTVEASANSAHCSGEINVTWTAQKQ